MDVQGTASNGSTRKTNSPFEVTRIMLVALFLCVGAVVVYFGRRLMQAEKHIKIINGERSHRLQREDLNDAIAYYMQSNPPPPHWQVPMMYPPPPFHPFQPQHPPTPSSPHPHPHPHQQATPFHAMPMPPPQMQVPVHPPPQAQGSPQPQQPQATSPMQHSAQVPTTSPTPVPTPAPPSPQPEGASAPPQFILPCAEVAEHSEGRENEREEGTDSSQHDPYDVVCNGDVCFVVKRNPTVATEIEECQLSTSEDDTYHTPIQPEGRRTQRKHSGLLQQSILLDPVIETVNALMASQPMSMPTFVTISSTHGDVDDFLAEENGRFEEVIEPTPTETEGVFDSESNESE